jgi:hypothetical protein
VLRNFDFYGTGVASLGDLDADGVDELAVGATSNANAFGSVFIHFMNSDGTVKSTSTITHGTANGPSLGVEDLYGYSVAALGDFDGDGVPDLAAGSRLDDTRGTSRGATYLHLLTSNVAIGADEDDTGADKAGALYLHFLNAREPPQNLTNQASSTNLAPAFGPERSATDVDAGPDSSAAAP